MNYAPVAFNSTSCQWRSKESRSCPCIAPIPTANRPYLMAVAQYNAIMASKSPPYNRMSGTKIEAKSSSGAAFNLNVLVAVAAEPKT